MLATQLVQGTQKVLPDTIIKSQDGSNKIETLKITNMVGTKSKIFSAVIRSSTDNKAYNTVIAFYGVDDPEGTKPSLAKHKCRVRCSCDAFYYYYSYADFINDCLYGRQARVYTRKTHPGDKNYRPPKNPADIPGVCKHLILLIKSLQDSGYVDS